MTNPNGNGFMDENYWNGPYEDRINGQSIEDLEPLPPYWAESPDGDPAMNRPAAAFSEEMFVGEINNNKRDSESQDDVDEHSSNRRKKKPKGTPKRPLSAYNFFFKEERARLMESGNQKNGPRILPSGKIGFEELAKRIGSAWGNLNDVQLQKYKDLAEQDLARYRKEMESLNENKEKEMPEDDHTRPNKGGVARLPRDAEPVGRPTYHVPGPNMNGSHQGYPMHGLIPAPDSHYPRCDGAASHANYTDDGMNYHSWDPRNAHPNSYHPQNYPFAGGVMSGTQEQSFPPNNQKPIPPGMEVFTRDHDGIERKFTVSYACVWIPQDEAAQFLDRISGREGPPHMASQPDISHMFHNILNGAQTIPPGPHHPNPSWPPLSRFGHDPTSYRPPNQLSPV